MDKHCRICHNTSCSNHGKNISFLGDGWKCNYIPVPTNADRIRAMSDEELAKAIFNWFFMKEHCDMCVPEMRTPKKCNGRCTSGILRWLQQPTEEADHVV